jgi:hypothetical protein
MKRKEPFWNFYQDGITQSFMRSFLHCKMQCFLSYVEGWSSDHEPIWFTYGKAFHYVLEQAYKSDRWRSPNQDELQEWLAIYRSRLLENRDRPMPMAKIQELELIFKMIEAIAPLYFAYYASDFGNDWNNLVTEEVFKVPYNNTWLNGCRDRLYEDCNDNLFLMDHKFLSVIDEDGIADTLYLDPQINIYGLAVEYDYGKLPKTVYLNVIRRPRDLPKKNESITAYCSNLQRKIMGDFTHWFKRISYTFTIEEHYAWRNNILRPVVDDIERWVNEGFPRYINTEALTSKYGKCSLFQLLTSDNDAGFYKRLHVFQELVA